MIMNTSNTVRFTAAAAAICITFSLFSGVVSLATLPAAAGTSEMIVKANQRQLAEMQNLSSNSAFTLQRLATR
jgi:hypothetical protein